MSKTKTRPLLLAALVTAGILACAHPAPPGRVAAPAPNTFPPNCVAAGAGSRHDSIRVIGDGAVRSQDAPVPRSAAERVAFGLAYETLVSADCRGDLEPGLAQAWGHDGDDWRFVLREDARFWDGAPVVATDVLAAWREHDSTLAERATAEGPGVVHVVGGDALDLVTRPSAAVTKPAPDHGWPIGTGPRWITGGTNDPDAEAVLEPTVPGAAPRITFARGSDDARDALEARADAVITNDRAALAYAATRARFAILPMAWTEVYVVIAPDQVAVDRADLVSAVRVDAAPAGTPVCPATTGRGARLAGPHRVAYRQGDPAAEALAARLIGSGALGRGVFAVALRGPEWQHAVDDGGEWAVIERRSAAAPCGGSWGQATPLIAVRSSVVVDRNLLPVRLSGDGSPRLGETVPR